MDTNEVDKTANAFDLELITHWSFMLRFYQGFVKRIESLSSERQFTRFETMELFATHRIYLGEEKFYKTPETR